METIMLSLKRQITSCRAALRAAKRRAAFTLSEIVIALAILGAMSTGAYIGFNSLTTYAVTSRLYTEALTAAQNQIDVVLSKAPFDVNAAYVSGGFNPALGKIPAELMTVAELDALGASGVTFPSSPPSAPPAKTDTYYPYYPYYRDGSTPNVLKKQAFIYQDPVTGITVVTGTLALNITDPGLTMTYLNSANLNIRRANATVSYTFRNKNYSVALDSMRTADQ
ncbi:MAG TPA: prepilin-type N-terminal cleavage/methylation domain-containing protein [Chthoniobacterales bacterium]|nr:prepilin-type N-terminal cleavage/methylation domain-containing protein [Chthoniobacterales bacterium]